MNISAYPLQWPEGWKRTQGVYRLDARFSKRPGYSNRGAVALTIADGVKRVLEELERMGLGRDDVVISTNVETLLDGFPRSDRTEPSDPGCAVYWQTKKGGRKVMAIDQYRRVADNLAAIAATLDAMRAIERHGGAAILERAFTGFTALPAPGAKRAWWEVLGVAKTCSQDDARTAFRRLASEAHPDKGGTDARMAELNAAWQAAQEAAP